MKRSMRSLFKMFCLLIGFCVVCSSAYAGLVTIDFPGAESTLAAGINNNNIIVGAYSMPDSENDGSLLYGFIYDPSQPETNRFSTVDIRPYLPDLTISTVAVAGINDFGTMIGGYAIQDEESPTRGFIYESGVFTPFDYPGASETWPTGINNSGMITGVWKSDPSVPMKVRHLPLEKLV